MALDGAFLLKLKQEIEENTLNSRVDRIYQPSREEIILGLRWKGGSGKLLLSAEANSARIHFTKASYENPKAPPMFCMFLRKHLGGAKLVNIRQIGLDRILHLVFETTNELGDPIIITVALEIMGRHSNIIVIDQENRVLDAVKRVGQEMSSVRQILPGIHYLLPPPQLGKKNLLEVDSWQVVEAIRQGRDVELSKALMEQISGISPLVAREVAGLVTRGTELQVSALSQEMWDKLGFQLGRLAKLLRQEKGTPTILFDLDEKPREFSFLEIHQYGRMRLSREYESYSELLDHFYSERDLRERIKQRSNDLLRLLANTSDRLIRKLAVQRQELLTSTQRGQLKEYGDLIQANLYQLNKGDRIAKVVNYFSQEMEEVEIELDPTLTPSQNAQRYYSDYRKADTAEKKLQALITEGEQELVYIDSVFDMLTRARTEGELNAIRGELAEQGYLRRTTKNKNGKPQREEKLPPMRYRSTDGFLILSGRNNLQNDKLTLKESRNYDIWFHTQKIPGSHTIVISEGKKVPNKTLEQAAIIAAYNSKARESSKVPVDYTYIKNVKKPNGAKPGMVIYETYETAVVNPDEQLVNSLREG